MNKEFRDKVNDTYYNHPCIELCKSAEELIEDVMNPPIVKNLIDNGERRIRSVRINDELNYIDPIDNIVPFPILPLFAVISIITFTHLYIRCNDDQSPIFNSRKIVTWIFYTISGIFMGPVMKWMLLYENNNMVLDSIKYTINRFKNIFY